MTKIKTAVFPVGGLGTRFLPATKSMPKEMLPVLNKPIIHHAFEEAKAAGIEKFIFITGRNKNAINNYFDRAYEIENSLDQKNKSGELEQIVGWLPDAGKIAFIRQTTPKGLGHAIWCARDFINEPFVVILADELFLEKKRGSFLASMIELYDRVNTGIIGVSQIDKRDSGKYGIIKTSSNQDSQEGKILDLVEKPAPEVAPSNLAITGRYILPAEIFNYLKDLNVGAGGEIQLTDAIAKMNEAKQFYYKKTDCERFDCGNLAGYFEANLAFSLADEKFKDQAKSIIKKYA